MVRGTVDAVTPGGDTMITKGGGLMLGDSQMMGCTAPDKVVVSLKLEKLIIDVVKTGIMMVVVIVMAV